MSNGKVSDKAEKGEKKSEKTTKEIRLKLNLLENGASEAVRIFSPTGCQGDFYEYIEWHLT